MEKKTLEQKIALIARCYWKISGGDTVVGLAIENHFGALTWMMVARNTYGRVEGEDVPEVVLTMPMIDAEGRDNDPTPLVDQALLVVYKAAVAKMTAWSRMTATDDSQRAIERLIREMEKEVVG